MKRYLGYQFKQALEELLRKIAKEFSLNLNGIYWSDEISTAGTNSCGDIMLADVADDAVLFDIDLRRYAGFAVHELLHQRYTDFGVRCNDQYLSQMHNAVEDAWIEHTGIDSNLTGNIGGLLSVLIDQMVSEAEVTVDDWSDPRQYPFIFAVYLRRHANIFPPIPQGLESIIHEASQRVGSCKSSSDTLRLADWIVSQLRGLPKNPSQPKSGDGKPSDGQAESESEGEGDGQTEGGKPSRKTIKGDGGVARAPEPDQEAEEVEPTLNAPRQTEGSGSWNERNGLAKPDRHHRETAWIDDASVVSARLRYEVKRLFDNSGMEDFQRNRRSGSINVNALHKVGITDKVFQRRHEVEGIDSAVVICLDVSSSMFDDGAKNPKYGCSDRIIQAVLTCEALLDTLNKAQVATALLTFGSRTAVLKPFGLHPSKAKAKVKAIQEGGSTNDYFAVRYAHKMLLNRPEQRKLCFVITDGMGDFNTTRTQCEVGERLGITTIGVGIGLDVSGVYRQSIRIEDAKQLGAVSFKQIKVCV